MDAITRVASNAGPSSRHHPDEILVVAGLLSAAGGCLDAFTWITHGVLANAQTANVVLLGVSAAAGHWKEALHYVPPIVAFVFGVAVATHLGAWVEDRARIVLLSLIVEIVILIVVMMLHLHLPEVAGTLGISFAAAVQTTSFTHVEGVPYSSVMTTGNLRSAVASLVTSLERGHEPTCLRRAAVFGAISAIFGIGAALGAFATKYLGSTALAIPTGLLLAALALCAFRLPIATSSGADRDGQ